MNYDNVSVMERSLRWRVMPSTLLYFKNDIWYNVANPLLTQVKDNYRWLREL